jgi:hypothetical protein
VISFLKEAARVRDLLSTVASDVPPRQPRARLRLRVAIAPSRSAPTAREHRPSLVDPTMRHPQRDAGVLGGGTAASAPASTGALEVAPAPAPSASSGTPFGTNAVSVRLPRGA